MRAQQLCASDERQRRQIDPDDCRRRQVRDIAQRPARSDETQAGGCARERLQKRLHPRIHEHFHLLIVVGRQERVHAIDKEQRALPTDVFGQADAFVAGCAGRRRRITEGGQRRCQKRIRRSLRAGAYRLRVERPCEDARRAMLRHLRQMIRPAAQQRRRAAAAFADDLREARVRIAPHVVKAAQFRVAPE